MKKLLLLCLLVFTSQMAISQIMINGKKVKLENLQYIEVEFFSLVGSNAVKSYIDFGQDINFLERKKRLLSDRNGKAQVFNSKVQGLNWYYANGWRVKEVYNPRTGGDAVNNDLIYLLEKVQ